MCLVVSLLLLLRTRSSAQNSLGCYLFLSIVNHCDCFSFTESFYFRLRRLPFSFNHENPIARYLTSILFIQSGFLIDNFSVTGYDICWCFKCNLCVIGFITIRINTGISLTGYFIFSRYKLKKTVVQVLNKNWQNFSKSNDIVS